MTTIEARNIVKTFGGQHGVKALKGVSLTVEPGEIVGLVGESGSGKTTMARIIIGIETASGGEVLYYPPAFSRQALASIEARVPPAQRIVAGDAAAAAFCVNAVCLDRTLVMAQAPAELRAALAERGYRLVEIDLSPFILSGGGAFCMTLRLDRTSAPVPALTAAE